jgi:hypothetical protein
MRLKPDKPKRVAAGTALVGKMARRATTRTNPHHLARLFLPLDTARLGSADAPSCDQSKSTFLSVVKGTNRHVVERAGINAPVRAGEESQDMNVLILRIGAGVAAINDEVLDRPRRIEPVI